MAPGAPINKIERAHQMYREGRYLQALGFYTEALSMAKTKPQKIALHSNRAACYLKLHHFNKVTLYFICPLFYWFLTWRISFKIISILFIRISIESASCLIAGFTNKSGFDHWNLSYIDYWCFSSLAI